MPNYDFDYSLPKYSHTGSKDVASALKSTTGKLSDGPKKSKSSKPSGKSYGHDKSPAKGGDMEY